MRFPIAPVIAILSASIGIAAADDFKPPATKEGLWETHSVYSRGGKTTTDQTVKMCQSNATTKSAQDEGAALRKRNDCTSRVTHPSANTYQEETTCAKGSNPGATTRVIYTNQGDTSSHTEMHIISGQDDTLVIMDAKYVGACPTSMKPGDLMMQDGKIISGGG
jgi:hypothetical protein